MEVELQLEQRADRLHEGHVSGDPAVHAAVGKRSRLDDLEVRSQDLVQRTPPAVRGVVEHLLDHAGDGRCAHAAAPENARSNALGSFHQTSDIARAFGSGKMSSTSAASPSRMPAATSAAGVFGASIPASMSVSMPPGYTPCTVMPRCASTGRSAWVSECAAALEAEYPAMGGVLARLRSERTLTTWPRPDDSSTGTNA